MAILALPASSHSGMHTVACTQWRAHSGGGSLTVTIVLPVPNCLLTCLPLLPTYHHHHCLPLGCLDGSGGVAPGAPLRRPAPQRSPRSDHVSAAVCGLHRLRPLPGPPAGFFLPHRHDCGLSFRRRILGAHTGTWRGIVAGGYYCKGISTNNGGGGSGGRGANFSLLTPPIISSLA